MALCPSMTSRRSLVSSTQHQIPLRHRRPTRWVSIQHGDRDGSRAVKTKQHAASLRAGLDRPVQPPNTLVESVRPLGSVESCCVGRVLGCWSGPRGLVESSGVGLVLVGWSSSRVLVAFSWVGRVRGSPWRRTGDGDGLLADHVVPTWRDEVRHPGRRVRPGILCAHMVAVTKPRHSPLGPPTIETTRRRPRTAGERCHQGRGVAQQRPVLQRADPEVTSTPLVTTHPQLRFG